MNIYIGNLSPEVTDEDLNKTVGELSLSRLPLKIGMRPGSCGQLYAVAS